MSTGPLPVHKPRLEALSDGVVAVALTLLVLELKIEHLPPHPTNDQVWDALRELKRPLIAYVVAFIWTSLFWYLHHQLLALLHRINGKFVALTLAFLLAISLLPFSVSLLMRSPTAGAAASIYYGNFALVGLTLLGSWLYARATGLADRASVATHALTFRLVSMTLAGVAATIAANFSYNLATLLFIVIAAIGGRLRRRFEARAVAPTAAVSVSASP